ncbi:MAG: 3'-5' exonuclease, partial [Planctomycetota bacterium]
RQKRMQHGRSNLTLVSFNGRTFDIPLLELAAFRYGIDIGDWMNNRGPSYEQPRNRYNAQSHLDLQEVMTNFGATRLNGGLNMLANLINKPGKMSVAGYMVQDMYAEGKVNEINDYCRCDVIDSYFVFLRTKVLYGEIDLDREQALVEQTKTWLSDRADTDPTIKSYLEYYQDWQNPWAD